MFSIAPKRSSAARALLPGAVTIAWGLALWAFAFGDPLIRASYDYLFLFTTRPVTNRVAVILMDNLSYDRLGQNRKNAWDRGIHAQLLNRLADDGCPLVALDVFLGETREPSGDEALAQASGRLSNVVLMAKQVEGALDPATNRGGFDSARPVLPAGMFLAAAKSNTGVAWFDPFPDPTVRKHWPYPSPGPYPSFAWTAARIAGANLDEEPRERWLRFYERGSAWASLPYYFAQNMPTNSFRDTVVFIGSQPETSLPGGEDDEFSTPFTRWTGASVGGVELHATAFLNLVNHEWLERPPPWIEAGAFVITGIALGAGLRRCRRRVAIAFAVLAALLALVAGAALTQFTNYWFPWLIVAGVQVPVALVLAITSRPRELALDSTIVIPSSPSVASVGPGGDILVYVPDYEIVQPPFGQGAYGKVWLARNAVGQWQALKAVYRSKFEDATPFKREFRGVEHFKPISRMHPGLLCIDFVSRIKPEGFFITSWNWATRRCRIGKRIPPATPRSISWL